MKEELFQNPQERRAAQQAILRARRAALLQAPPEAAGLALLQELHRRLFEGLDDEAGQLRRVDLPRAGERTPICYTYYLEQEQQRVFSELAEKGSMRELPEGELALELALLDAQLFVLHPFRAGNDLAIDCFLAILAGRAGRALWPEACTPDELEAARQAGIRGKLSQLCDCYRNMLQKP